MDAGAAPRRRSVESGAKVNQSRSGAGLLHERSCRRNVCRAVLHTSALMLGFGDIAALVVRLTVWGVFASVADAVIVIG